MANTAERAQPIILGLTGPVACGKTTVGDLLLRLGALARIDTDRVVHELLNGGPVADEVVEAFGRDILGPSGLIDRRKLGSRVFADPSALARLEAIVHPPVTRVVRQKISEVSGRNGVVVVDAVKLLQSELLPLCSAIWVVTCDREEERRRLIGIRAMTAPDADARLAAQPSFDHPAVSALIRNDGSLAELEDQVSTLWNRLIRSSPDRGD
ncbi:MAG TPA: dephospho-CoA kinase [Chloroflexota bacterium]|nr:dephospho-CoA kinase [Chloroflexota bacterium]